MPTKLNHEFWETVASEIEPDSDKCYLCDMSPTFRTAWGCSAIAPPHRAVIQELADSFLATLAPSPTHTRSTGSVYLFTLSREGRGGGDVLARSIRREIRLAFLQYALQASQLNEH